MMKSGVSGALRRQVFRRDGYSCQHCNILGVETKFPRGGYGYPTSIDGIYLSIDHLFPKSLGGASTLDNLRVLCTKCNTRKGIKRETD